MTASLSRKECLCKLTGQAKRALIRETGEGSSWQLEKLQKSTVGKSVHRTIISHVLHESVFYGGVVRRKLLLNKRPKTSHLLLVTIHVVETSNMEEDALVR